MEILFLVLGLILGILFIKYKGAGSGNIRELETKLFALDKEKGVMEADLRNYMNRSNEYATLLKSEQEEVKALTAALSESRTLCKNLDEKLSKQKAEVEELQNRLTTEFKNIASIIMEEKAKKFTEQNKTNLDGILNPLKDRIKEFEEKVDRTYKAESSERITLKTELKHLVDLNKRISDEANSLAKALQGDNKKQGNWGETRLEMLLANAGLQEGIHYRKQAVLKDEEGRSKQPDFIINLPDNKHIIVDSKVSLNAYVAYYNSEDAEQKKIYVKNHIESIKNHIKDLGSKNYQSLYQINSPDYVLMYIPIEPAFTLAHEYDNEVMVWALEDKRVVLVTTSTLLATLSTISYIWRQENQKRNALEIARQGGALYDKFVNFVDDLIAVGKKIGEAKISYEDAMKKLYEGQGNLIKRAENLKALGAKTTKTFKPSLLERAEEDSENFNPLEEKTL